MPEYVAEYSNAFEKCAEANFTDKKSKGMLEKAINVILEKPYIEIGKVQGLKAKQTIFRKHICAERFRIFYSVDESNKIVKFTTIRPKNKNTYKGL